MKKTGIIERSFQNWTRNDLMKYLGVKPKKNFKLLEDWLVMDKKITLSKDEIEFLESVRELAIELIDFWNETELRENFIIELTKKVNFRDPNRLISPFSERHLSAIIQKKNAKIKLHGYTDWFVSEGFMSPERPFFFIHEYKPFEAKVNDGKGQLISAMYAAQHLNLQPLEQNLRAATIHYYKDIPVYGCYVIRRNWFFGALQGDQYAISNAYLSTRKSDLQTIFKLLKAQKQMILEKVENKQLVEV